MRHLLIVISSFLATIPATANNLQISNVMWDGGTSVTFTISWDNSWRGPGVNPGFHDAVWVFAKVAASGGPTWAHATMDVTDEGPFDVITPPDLNGAFIRRANAGTGSVSGTVSFDLGAEFGLFPDIKIFGVEMVYIPLGPFYLGDGASDNRFHVGNDTTAPYLVSNSGVITIGNGPNDLNSSAGGLPLSQYPETFPNGYDAFYCMKYELSQIQYAEFLNCLTLPQQNSRTATDLTTDFMSKYVMTDQDTVYNRNSIRCIHPQNGDPLYFFCDLDQDGIPNEGSDGQNLAANYVSYDDLLAYLDWAAMRPMTHMQYEKICRGPAVPVPLERAWGTPTFTAPGNIVNNGTANETFDNIGATGVYGNPPSALARCGFAATATSNRLSSGATYYGVMEMSGNVREPCAISSQHKETDIGDGNLTAEGFNDAFFIPFMGKGAVPQALGVSYNASSFGTVGDARVSASGGRGIR